MDDFGHFDVIIRRRKNKVTAMVPPLGLYATATDLAGALKALDAKKAQLLGDITEANALDTLSPAAAVASLPPGMSRASDFAQLTLKFGFVVVVMAIATAVTGKIVSYQIKAAVNLARYSMQEGIEDARTKIQTSIQTSVNSTIEKYGIVNIGGPQFWEKGREQSA